MSVKSSVLSIDAIPEALRARAHWVVWRYEARTGDPKPTKIPYNARTGGKASTTDLSTWSMFEEAAGAQGYDGIGYVFAPEDEIVGIDLDHCRNPATGLIEPWAVDILGDTRSYTEVSPSGQGLHIFIRGHLPAGARKRGLIEMYERGRYFTVTGHVVDDSLVDLRAPVLSMLELHAKLFPPAPAYEQNGAGPTGASGDLDDATVIERAKQAANGAKFRALWAGDTSGYPSQSEADLALCSHLAFWTGRNGAQMDRLFRQSGLMREKWNERHGAATYGALTIERALTGCHDAYSLSQVAPRSTKPRTSEQTPLDPMAPKSTGGAPPEPAPTSTVGWPLYDGANTWGFPPPQPLVEGLLVLDGVTWIGGRPKSFKSLLALYLCLGIAARRPEVAGRFKVRATPQILYVGREDGGARFEVRRDEVLACWNARLEPRSMLFAIRPHLDLLKPEHVAWLRDTCRREGITLLVLDTWTALSPGADPMAPKDQAQLAAVIVQLAQDIAGHVVVVDHSRKNRPEGQALSSADIFGPLQKWAAADNTVMLERVGSSSRIEVYVEGKDIDSSQFFLEVSPRGSGLEKFTHAGTVAELAVAQRAVGDQNRQAVRLVVSNSAVPLSREEVGQRLRAEDVKLGPDTVKKHLGALVNSGVLRLIGRAKATRYAAAVSPPSSPIASPIQEGLYGNHT